MKKFIVLLLMMMMMVVTVSGCGEKNLTLGGILKEDFESQLKANKDITAQELVDNMCNNEKIPFQMMSVPVEPGNLMGFDNVEIKGFKEGVMFSPMIGTIPFIGYVFVLEEGTDEDEFMTLLTSNANPRWNICTEAEETVITKVDNKILFLMSPKDTDMA